MRSSRVWAGAQVARNPWSRAVSMFERSVAAFCMPDPQTLELSCALGIDSQGELVGHAVRRTPLNDPRLARRRRTAVPRRGR